MEKLTLEDAANYEPPIPECYENGESLAYTVGHKKGFVVGGNWQKEQYKHILQGHIESVLACLSNDLAREYEKQQLRNIIKLLQD